MFLFELLQAVMTFRHNFRQYVMWCIWYGWMRLMFQIQFANPNSITIISTSLKLLMLTMHLDESKELLQKVV